MPSPILLVAESDQGFHDKLSRHSRKSLIAADFEPIGFITKPVITPEAWVDTFEKAALYNTKYIHIARLLNPTPLLQALKRCSLPEDFKISFLVMGLGENIRRPERKESLAALAAHPNISKILVVSIHPESLHRLCVENGYLRSPKVAFLHEPPYERQSDYRRIPKYHARFVLNVPETARLALYFGTYWFSKGPDLLLGVAKVTPDITFAFVGDTRLGSIKVNPEDYLKYRNIRFCDYYVSEQEAVFWFRAADIVVLPYRNFYENDTSGIFTQAMQAERPVVVPDFPPFSNLHGEFQGTSVMFKAEDPESLKLAIDLMLKAGLADQYKNFDAYLAQQGSWGEIGRAIL